MKRFLALAALALPAITPAFAHHSVAGDYFMEQRSTVDGELVQFLYRNPHSFVEMKVKDAASGEMVNYSVEWNGAGRLGRMGINADTLKPGDHIVITGQPGRKPEEHRLHMLDISRPADGWKWNRSANR